MSKGAPNQLAGLSAPSLFASLRRQGAVLFLTVVSLLPFSVLAQAASNPQFNELAALAQTGMSDLSLALIERDQPPLDKNPGGWAEWQQQKIAIFKLSGQWQRIIHEYETVSSNAPASYLAWLQLRVVEAYLALGDGEAARDLLLPLIWGDNSDQAALAEMRRLVIMSYLMEERIGEAHSAMLRYEQDYSDVKDNPVWIATKARVMIADGQPDDAALVAVISKDPEGKAVYTLARLKGDAAMNEELLRESVAALNNVELDQPLRQALFAVALEKGLSVPEPSERIVVLQQLLSVVDIKDISITTAVDGLWSAYGKYGQEVANRMQLLVGNFTPWFDAASQLQTTAPVQAEALYAWLILNVKNSELQAKAHEEFAAQLRSQSRGDVLLRALYLSSSHYGDVRKLPVAVLFQLIDMALTEGDVAHATQLMKQVDLPRSVERRLRQARLQILSGTPEMGASQLMALVNSQSLTTAQAEYLLQVLYDLQNGNQHQQAYTILAALLPKLRDQNLRCEVLFLMADSRMAQGDPLEAARLYLGSAMLGDSNSMDDWGQMAREQAADALFKAELSADSIELYRDLQRAIDNPAQRALLQRKIQRHSAQH